MVKDLLQVWMARARGLYTQGNWRAAEALCQHILTIKPHHPAALLYGGLCAARGAVVVNFRLSTAYNVAFDAIALQYEAKGPSQSFFAFCAHALHLLRDLTQEVLDEQAGYLISDKNSVEPQDLNTLVSLVTRTFLKRFQGLAIPDHAAATDAFFVEYMRLLCRFYECEQVDEETKKEDVTTLHRFAIPEDSEAKVWERAFWETIRTYPDRDTKG